MRSDLPSGTVTFLFTDVEGSTRLLHERGAEGYAEALAAHRVLIREACSRHSGVEVDTQGDAFFFAFPTAPGAIEAASAFTGALASGPIQVRVGLHTGTPLLTDEGYVGSDVHRAARIAAAGHGGQVLVSASMAQLVELDLIDLGERRLKDLSAPERIYQLGDSEFPALKSLYRTNLPVPATHFLGREAELAEVALLLERDDVRLLTLTGPGGTGKTRLALQAVAAAADAYPDGVWWVPLAPLRDPALVLEEASQTLGAKDGLADYISDREILLLFDNFEQVVEAAPGVSELLVSCPNLRLVVTSRELLQVPGEQAYAVPPLVEDDGTELFLARARAADPGFQPSEAVRELCAKLEQLPLALELAAARIRALTPEQLIDRLSGRLDLLKAGRGVDPRQQTLRATIEWSYDLLTEGERRLFARLSVFRGGCTLEAAEDVCGAELDTMQSLVEKSLVRFSSERYWMLETIREYASECLDASAQSDELRGRHAEHFVALAEEAEPNLRGGPAEKEWLNILEHEHDNLRAALDRLEESDTTERNQRLAAALVGFWVIRGHIDEGARRLERALRADERLTTARADLLHGLGMLEEMRGGSLAAATAHLEEALSIYSRLETRSANASLAMHTLGLAVAEEGHYQRARQLFAESVQASRGLGEHHYVLVASDSLAWIYNALGDRERAKAIYNDNLVLARTTSNRRIEAWSLDALAMIAVDEGHVHEALAMLNESLAIYREFALSPDIANSFSWFAAALVKAGKANAAAALLSRSLALHEAIGAAVGFWVAKRNDKTMSEIRARLDDAAFNEAWELGRTLTVDEAVALALAEARVDA